MGADIETGIPANVVEIGTEVTQGIVDALNTAPSPTAVNRFAVINDLNAKADLAGCTFTGKINCSSVGGAAGINVGIGGNSGVTMAGDLWIAAGGSTLNFRDATGGWRVLASLSGTNAWTGTNTFVTQPVTDSSTKAATTEYVKKFAPDVTSHTGSTFIITGTSQYNRIIKLASGGSAQIQIDASSNTLPNGTQFVFIQTDTTAKSFFPLAGVTLFSQGNRFQLNGQHSVATLIKTGTNEWYLSGNLI